MHTNGHNVANKCIKRRFAASFCKEELVNLEQNCSLGILEKKLYYGSVIYTGPGKKPISRKCVLLIPYYGDFSSNKEPIFRKCVLLVHMPFGANNLIGIPIFRKCVLLVPVLWSLAIFIVAPLALDKRLHRSHNN